MMLFRILSLLSLSTALIPLSVVQGYARVVETSSPYEQKKESLPERTKPAEHPVLAKPKKYGKSYNHMVSGSLALRRLDVDEYSYSNFNSQAIQNIDEKAVNDISFDYSFAYHYRPSAAYSLGFSFDRLQINNNALDLRYASIDPIAPSPSTLPLIASDLTSGNTYAIANYYSPKEFGNRGYAYEGVARAYILPKWTTDPFLQATIGYTHNRGHVVREDGSMYILSTDQLWTWSIGAGFFYQIDPSWRIETLTMIRNQNQVKFGDNISAPSQSAQYSFYGYADRYYSADLKISLCRTW